MSVIVEGIGLGGSAQLDHWIQNFRDKLPPEDAKIHEEQFQKIFKDEEKRFMENRFKQQLSYNPSTVTELGL